MADPTIAKRFVISVCTHLAAGAALYAWQVLGIEQAGNVFIFYMWFSAILFSLHVLIAAYPPKKREPQQCWLFRLNTLAWLFFVGALIWIGYVFLPTVMVFGMTFVLVVASKYDDDGKLKPEGAENE